MKKIYSHKIFLFILVLVFVFMSHKEAVWAKPSLPQAFISHSVEIGFASRFKPVHKYACMQNPPDFTWPQIDGAYSYDVIVCKDEALTDIVYRKDDIRYAYYNFNYTFEPGVYWWSVRYRITSSGEASDWSVARRFRIDSEAYEFVVPDFDELIASVSVTHPRIYFTEDGAPELKELKNSPRGNDIYEKMISDTKKAMTSRLEQDTTDISQTITDRSQNLGAKIQKAALCYHLTDDPDQKKRYGDFAVDALVHLSSWDYKNGGSALAGNDQAFFDVLMRASMAYDWMYNYMVEEDREDDLETIRNMLSGRFDYIKDYQLQKLRQEPYESHYWSYLGYYGIASMALLHDIEGIDNYFKQMLELYTAQVPPMSVEDGGWSKGTGYWRYAFARDKWFMDVMAAGGYINYYDKAWTRNELKWALYTYPDNSWSSFGDGAGMYKPANYHIMGLSKLGKHTDNPVAYWLRNRIGEVGSTLNEVSFDAIMYADTADAQTLAPIDYPKAHLFEDQGMVAMHSTLLNKNRTSLYFHSGEYGSYNHLHADQNAFIIEDNGNKLATQSGYYDYYDSEHHKNFSRQTFAHNAITYAGGQGQKTSSMDAKGNIKQFVTHYDFDAVVGDATDAYMGSIDKAQRSIIYLRPDRYIVVDELSDDAMQPYEWWLHSPEGTMTVDGTNVSISNNGSSLDVEMVYPKGLNGEYSGDYISPFNGKEYAPSGNYALKPVADRVMFRTNHAYKTTIVACMSVNRENDFITEEFDGYIKITPQNDDENTVIYIPIGQSGSVVIDNKYIFDGTALVVSDSSIMLVNASSLNSVNRFTEPVTLVAGRGQLSVSSDDDTEITIRRNNIIGSYLPKDISNITDSFGRSLKENDPSAFTDEINGITASLTNTNLKLYAHKGNYRLTFDEDAPVSGDEYMPLNVVVNKESDGTAILTWDNYREDVNYTVRINGNVYSNISFPYNFSIEDEQQFFISLMGEKKGIKSSWTEENLFEPERETEVSYVEFVKSPYSDEVVTSYREGEEIYAKVNVAAAGRDEISLALAQHDSAGNLVNSNVDNYRLISDREVIISKPVRIENTGNTVKAFILDSHNIAPKVQSATVNGAPVLKEIIVDDIKLADFSGDKYDYDYILDTDGILPVVKGIAVNNSCYVTTSYTVSADKKTAFAKVKTAFADAERVYTINFILPEGAEEIRSHIENFTYICDGMDYSEYCDYVESIYDVDLDVGYLTPEGSRHRIPSRYEIFTAETDGRLTGLNSQRKFTWINKRYNLEGAYLIAPDPGISQEDNTSTWIKSAFYGCETFYKAEDGKTYRFAFGDYSVPWFSFNVNCDCEVMIFSQYEVNFCEKDPTWRYTYLEEDPYKAQRTDPAGAVTEIDSFRNMYTAKFKAGDTVVLYNEDGGYYSIIPYIVFVRPQ